MSSRREAQVSNYSWLSASSEASCLTIVVGSDIAAAASAFGVDLADSVDMQSERWSTERVAAVVNLEGDDAITGPVSAVLEDNGFEGSREVVLRAASRGGKAASIFWNVNGVVVFSCARRGKLLWSGELGMGEDREGLPRSLQPFAELLEADEELDPVAAGAAMAASFTGVQVRPELLKNVSWSTVSPHVEQPEPISAGASALRWHHGDLLSALVDVAPENRRALVHAISHAAVRQASLVEDEVVATVLNTVRYDGPGAISTGFESWERRWARESDGLWWARDEAINNGGVEPLPEEEQRVDRSVWVAKTLRYACHEDGLSALLGVADTTVHIFKLDGHEDRVAQALRAAANAARIARVSSLDGLPAPPSAKDRNEDLEEQRRRRQRAEQDAEAEAEAALWGGRPPTARMRASGGAYALAYRDRDLLDLLDPLPDDLLAAIAAWAARRVLSDAGLWDLPWVQDATRGDSQLNQLFELLFSDPRVRHTDFLDDEGRRCSRQAMALPAVAVYSLTDPFDAACTALAPAGDGPRPEAAAIYRETRERFGLK